MSLPFHLIQKRLTKLHDLGRDDVLTIGLEWIVEKVFLVIVLGNVKDRKGTHFRDNLPIPDFRRRDLRDRFHRDLSLGFVVREDGGPVLRAHIVPLTVQCRGIVDREENPQNFLEGNGLRIERELDDFGVTGGAFADLIIRRVRDGAATVAGHHFVYPFAFQIDRLQTPETATTESGEFLTVVRARLQWFFIHRGCPLLFCPLLINERRGRINLS